MDFWFPVRYLSGGHRHLLKNVFSVSGADDVGGGDLGGDIDLGGVLVTILLSVGDGVELLSAGG